jgi:hypothetical protein
MTQIAYSGRHIRVEEVEEIGGDLNNLYDYNDTLYRDAAGNYYLKQERSFKMPPNADRAFLEQVAEIGYLPGNHPEMRRLRAFRQRHMKPRVTIKRIKEKTALLWWIHEMCNDEQMKKRLRDAVTSLSKIKALYDEKD